MKKTLSVLLACLLVLMPLVVSCAETAGEKNALAAAKLYLSSMPLSYQGVLDQLEFDGYTSSEAQYGADNCGASWKEQAVRSAETYLGTMPLSEKRLREQLSFDGYTDEEVEYAIEKAYNGDGVTSQAALKKAEQTADKLVVMEPDNFFHITEIIKESIPMTDFDKLMSDRGYTGAPSPVIGDTTVYSNQSANPYQVLVAFNSATKKTTGSAIVYYSKDEATLSYLIELFTKQFGTPAPTPDKQSTGESLNWNSNGTKYQLSVLGTLDNAREGNEDFFLIIDNESNEGNETEDYYSQLSDDERKFLDNFMCSVDSFKYPSTLKLVNVYGHKEQPGMMYIVEVSAENALGIASTDRYICMYSIILEAKNDAEIKKQKVDVNFDIALLNKALKQKLKEKGY